MTTNKFIFLRQSIRCFTIAALLFSGKTVAQKTVAAGTMEVGEARIDISPYGPIRLSGYVWGRKTESEGVLQQLWAKALVFGSDAQGPSVLITVDLAGIPAWIRARVATYLSQKAGIKNSQLAINASHTHSGPDMGNSHNMYFDPFLPVDQLGRIAMYLDSLAPKLEKVAMEALKNRKPSLVSWGQGSVGFGLNRRVIINGKWSGHGKVPNGPVDHTMPLLKVTDLNGQLKAILVGYACHGTTLYDDINKAHGDWIGEAQLHIEASHPEAIAMVTTGCGGDVDPDLRGTLEYAALHGQTIATEVDRLLATPLESLTSPPIGHFKQIQLPFDHVPGSEELIKMTKDKGAKAHNASVFLERRVRGIPIETGLTYPVQTWTFGNKLAIVFLGGEVVSEYSLRLRKELGKEKLWVNAYSNDVKAYIPSKRMIPEGGYEVESNMYYYDHPSRFSDKIEDIIIGTVYELLPASFKPATRKKAVAR